MSKKGISDVPLIMGVIGTVLNIPATLCAATCGAIISGVSKMAGSDSGSNFGDFIVFSALVSGFTGLAGGIYAKSNPNTGGTLLLIATLFSGIELVTIANFFSFIVFVLFLIGAIYAFVKTTDNAEIKPSNVQNVTIGNINTNPHSVRAETLTKKRVVFKDTNNYPSEGKIKNPYK